MKKFKLVCGRSHSFCSLVIKRKHYTALIEPYGRGTFLIVITSSVDIEEEAVRENIRVARKLSSLKV